MSYIVMSVFYLTRGAGDATITQYLRSGVDLSHSYFIAEEGSRYMTPQDFVSTLNRFTIRRYPMCWTEEAHCVSLRQREYLSERQLDGVLRLLYLKPYPPHVLRRQRGYIEWHEL